MVEYLRPKGRTSTRDSTAAGQGQRVPPHVDVPSKLSSVEQTWVQCGHICEIAAGVAEHLKRARRAPSKKAHEGDAVFIGHGRSSAWRELLDRAAIGFLIMTGEDETSHGAIHPRLNVVHEAGLFQGRLGFARAIVLIEEGCEEFSNVAGLGQIRFPKGRIRAAFEEVRGVLEREGLLPTK